jgi:DNA-binding winged helix-turn-helix (wHTH) protein
MNTCPHCGRHTDRPALKVFPAGRFVRRGDRVVRLGVRELVVFQVLRAAAPMPVAVDDLQKVVSVARPARVIVHALRRKLPRVGADIETCGRGFYRLVERRK